MRCDVGRQHSIDSVFLRKLGLSGLSTMPFPLGNGIPAVGDLASAFLCQDPRFVSGNRSMKSERRPSRQRIANDLRSAGASVSPAFKASTRRLVIFPLMNSSKSLCTHCAHLLWGIQGIWGKLWESVGMS